jgi:Carboxypeptidase regulatory-like domain
MVTARSRKAFVVLWAAGIVTLAAPSLAQVQRGVIHGTVHDQSGAVLPGALVELTSHMGAPREVATGSRGDYRFQDLDPGRYTLRATLEGFAPLVRPDVIVEVGASVEIRVEMRIGGVTEELIVNATSPVLDSRRQGNVTNFDKVMLEEVPTARDPWALMQHLPGVSIGRPNVGGSESTNQAQLAARGDNGQNTMWNLDGVTITDIASIGTSTTYFDFNVFEEVQYTTSGMDPRQLTGGLGINMVSKRGTSKLRASSRVYFTNDDLQGENVTGSQKAAGLTGNRIMQLAEYGGDVGGPLRTERLWFWTGASRNDVRQLSINGYPDIGAVNTAAARGDAQAGTATRFSFLYHYAEKVKTGRFAGPDRPPDTTLNQDGGTQIAKAEVSHVFGPAMFLSGKFAYIDVGFGLTPQGGVNTQAYRDFAAQVWHGSHLITRQDRSQYQTQIDGNRQHGAHDVKFGVQLRRTLRDDRAAWPGDETYTVVNAEAVGLPPGVGFANLTRQQVLSQETGALSVYGGDVLALDRWTFDLGLRVDWQRVRNRPSRAPANGLAPSILPALDYPGGPYHGWTDWSPRLGVTVRASDRTLVRGSYSRYPSQQPNLATFENAASMATIQYRFADANGDRLAQIAELLGPTGSVTGVNPADPAAPYAPNRVDPDITSPALHVLGGGVEREMFPNFSLAVSAGYTDLTNATWSRFIGLTRDDFVEYRTAGTATVRSDTPVYRLAPGVALPPGQARTLTNREDYHRRYWNVDLVATKRFADGWMLRGFITRQQHREYFTGSESVQDGTPRFDSAPPSVSGLVDGGLAISPGEIVIHAKWMYSLAAVYELPWQMSVSGALYGRQGYPTAETITVNRPDGLGLTQVLRDRDLDAARFPDVHLLDLRLQKRLSMGRLKATLDLDLFNTLNNAGTLRQVGEATAVTFRNPLEMVAPRLMRLGLRLQL